MEQNWMTRKGRRNLLSSRLKGTRHRGAVLLMVAGGIVVLCGFAALTVDYGRSVLTKNQLQRACDAAALAGVEWLPNDPTTARTAAVYWAYQNGQVVVDPSNVVITNDATNGSTIRVSAKRQVNFLFAPVMRIFKGDVNATARAAIVQRNALPGRTVVPIGVTPGTYTKNAGGNLVDIKIIRQNKADLNDYEFVMFDLRDNKNAKSSAHMLNQLEWNTGFTEETYLYPGTAEHPGTETTLNAANAAQDKKVQAALKTRTDEARDNPKYNDNGDKFDDIPAGSPRLMYFLVTPDQDAVNGTNNARIKAFVPVYFVDWYEAKNGDFFLRVRFLPTDYNAGGTMTPVNGTDPDAAPFQLKRLLN